jgi:hypothetical protein
MSFSPTDIDQIEKKGIDPEQAKTQLESFKTGFPYMKLVAPCIPNRGITIFSEETLLAHAERFNMETSVSKTKFVPASGAASRMFKDIFKFIENPNIHEPIVKTLQYYQTFAFGEDIDDALGPVDTSKVEDLLKIAEFIVNSNVLGYGTKPKGMIKFHKYPGGNRTAFEEHLVEAAKYSSKDNIAKIHFTVSANHQTDIQHLINHVIPNYERTYNVTYDVTYSIQKPSTDTIAADENNEQFVEDGEILFRPGGHGALIHNLNDIDEELIFIKNIDNVVPDYLKVRTVEYKKALAGLLLKTKDKIHDIIKNIDNEKTYHLGWQFAKENFGIEAESREELINALNRPIRVCGMVKNAGEPGGGPFWAQNSDGQISAQIVESSQIDPLSGTQKEIISNATHFNPVDLICYTHSYTGEKFNLLDYIDHNTGFITHKSRGGRDVKALELPGLWNGAMANWLSIFVEVPSITFNPVKTITDLLRKEHLS